MPKYRTEIDGKTYEFEAADPTAAAQAIDEAKTQSAIAPIAKYSGEVFSGDPARANRAISREEGRQAGPGATAGIGLQAGTLRNFNDELAGLSEASGMPVGTPPIISGPVGAARMGLEKLGIGQGAGQAYDVGRERMRGFYEGAQEANPGTALASEIAGGLAGPNPTGAGLSVAQRMGQGALVAGAEGALSGAGAGEGAQGRAEGAAVGGGISSIFGGALPLISNVAGKLYRAVVPHSDEAIQQVAERQTGQTMRRDLERMTPEQRANLQAGEQAGQPLVLGDLGGEGTRTLARTSANQSDEARAALSEVTGGRFANQGQRASTWWDQITDAPRALQTRERLQDAAEMANRPAYRRAYAAGEGGVWDDVLQGLTTSPAVRTAIRDAEATGADRAAVQGFRAPRNPFQAAEDGTLTLRRNPDGSAAVPSLQFWDHVQRNLRSVTDKAVRAGDNETADRVGQLRRALNNHLDAAIPEFGQARRGAASWFGADDALEAGQRFLAQDLRGGHGEAAQALGRMNQYEQQLFRQGVAESVRNRMHALSDNQDINQLFKNPEMRDRLRLALGPELSGRLTRYLDVERTMTQLRRSVSGNSSTAQQLISAAGGGMAGQFLGDDPLERAQYGGVGAIAGAVLARGNARLNQRVATHIGNLLSSGDPADWQRVANMARSNPTINRAWNELKNYAQRAAAQQAGGYAGEELSR